MSGAELPAADPRVVNPVHTRIMTCVGEAGRAYGLSDLRLEGGTALSAYHLHHRQSEDLDFFAGAAMDAADFRSFVAGRLTEHGLHLVEAGAASRGFAEFYISDRPVAVPARERQTVKVQFGRTSPFVLSPLEPTREGVSVASYRDLCAGKLHALCDRYEPRDFIDLHCILTRSGIGDPVDDAGMRRRFRDLLFDLERTDPGLNEVRVGEALTRGIDNPIVSGFPLALLVPIREESVQASIRLAGDECARIAAEHWQQG